MAYGETGLRGIGSRRYVNSHGGHDGGQRTRSGLIDVTVANAARASDFLAGGQGNFAVDRRAATALVESAPSVAAIPPSVLAFRRRVVRYLSADAGIRQFLDVGDGLVPPADTHQVAQAADPTSRIVYVESDPMVVARANMTLASAPGGLVTYLDGQVTDADGIVAAALGGPAPLLDASRPLAVLLLSTLSHVPAAADAATVVAALMDPAPAGSYLAMYHLASDLDPAMADAFNRWNATADVPIGLRSAAEVAALATGLELVPPGLVPLNDWRPDDLNPAPGSRSRCTPWSPANPDILCPDIL